MPITTLDPKSALIIIDLQNGIAASPVVHPAQDIIARSNALAAAFRARGLPVVIVRVTKAPGGRTDSGVMDLSQAPAGFSEIVPELDQAADDIHISKHSFGAFGTTDLEDQLRARGVTQVVITGISTSIGVESTARHAFDRGFNVTLPIDAMTDRNAAAHNASIAHIFPRLAETGTTEELLALLEGQPG
ncbi:hydrolase [Thioclava dalianensis]|uniref:Hydrolase n=1 Tax=Thioclava dalianensis TaxID=1185766 RepID=A0A074U3R8_9RHOB|nr:isochorismatase family cysteine hydrolase [Thioclava dalianensis]KEP69247.1 hydrolase [Thioclava dalianensis]SFM72932.1 Nicotinamidase-related amidase [Thioclava dalianensis]